MSRTTKSTLALARTALDAAGRVLPGYGHPNSPRTFTRAQLLAVLCVKEFERLDYRGVCVKLGEWRELRDALGLTRVPHHTTLVKAAGRLLGGKSGVLAARRLGGPVAGARAAR